jgi:nucleotide-binding universal stress UspA family protein
MTTVNDGGVPPAHPGACVRWREEMEARMIKDVMVRLDGTRADEARLAAADQIAEYFDSDVIGLFLNVLPVLIPAEADPAVTLESARLVDQAHAVGDALEARLRHRLAQLQKPVELRRFDTFGDVMRDIAAREARTADVFVAMRPNGSAQEPEQLVESVLFETGRHLFLVPEKEAAPEAFDHIMIAWNGGREATRAVTEAMPYLHKAEKVSVVVVDDGEPVEEQATMGKNLVEHLLHHGIGAAIHHVKQDGSVAATLIAESKRLKPDLIVMGGYGHSKLREWLLGGASYEMLHNAPVPLVIAH